MGGALISFRRIESKQKKFNLQNWFSFSGWNTFFTVFQSF
jgi:hypothetical protein